MSSSFSVGRSFRDLRIVNSGSRDCGRFDLGSRRALFKLIVAANKQSLAVAKSRHENKDQAFIDAISDREE